MLRKAALWTRLQIGIQCAGFEQAGKMQAGGLRAKLVEVDAHVGVLDREDGFACRDERGEVGAPALGEAVFGQGPVEVGQKFGKLL